MRDYEWIIAGVEANTLSCLRCGQKHLVDVPMALGLFQKALKAFIILHKTCEEKPEHV